MPAPRRLRVFRIKDGVRIPYVLELDHELTVMAEYADTTQLDHIAEGRGGKRRVPDSPSRRIATALARWCTKAVEENPLPGTDALRDKYFDELEDLQTKFAAKNQKCPGCEISKLMRKYREKLEKAGHFSHLM